MTWLWSVCSTELCQDNFVVVPPHVSRCVPGIDDQVGVFKNPLPVISGVIRHDDEAILQSQVIRRRLLAGHVKVWAMAH